MKKLCLLLLASVFMLGDVCHARADSEEKEHKMMCYACGKPMKKCKCNKPKKEKAHKPKKEKVHKEKSYKVKKEKAYKEKNHKPKKIKVHKEKSHKAKKVKVHKDEKKHEKRQSAHAKKQRDLVKREEHAAKMDAKHAKSKARAEEKKRLAAHKDKALQDNHRDEIRRKHQDVAHERKERAMLIEKWDRVSAENQHRDLVAGAQADLFTIPAVPTHALWYEGKNFINASMKYDYACNAYGSDGSSSNRNITAHAFGDQPITLSDICLASKLVTAGTVAQAEPTLTPNIALQSSDKYLNYLSSASISLKGRAETYGLSLEIGRYIVNRDVAIGVNVPVLYNRHRLKVETNIPDTAKDPGADFNQGVFGTSRMFVNDGAHVLDMQAGIAIAAIAGNPVAPVNNAVGAAVVPVVSTVVLPAIPAVPANPIVSIPGNAAGNAVLGAPNLLQRRYGGSADAMVKDLLLAKGFIENGGSAMGMGDVSFYANYQVNSVHFDKLVLGVRGVAPTAKKASNAKLWAPELGNGGFFEASVYGSVLMNYQKYLNPSVMLEVGFCAPAHVDRRVAKKVAFDITAVAANAGANPTAGELLAANTALDNAGFSFRNRIAPMDEAGNAAAVVGGAGAGTGLKGVSVNEFDTTIKGFADKVQNVKITKGPQVNLRVGNTIERFICPRGYMDVFYDFRAKGKDRASGLDRTNFNLDMIEQHTVELEHRVGLEYAYQYDQFTRTHLGLGYTFAGMNVPKTFEISGSLNHAF